MITRKVFAPALALLLLLVCLPDDIFAKGKSGSKGKSVSVRGYTRKDGTYVRPHYRSAPNGTSSDNWSTRGNVNPYTGEVGTKDPNAASPPRIGTGASRPRRSTSTTSAASAIGVDFGTTTEGRGQRDTLAPSPPLVSFEVDEADGTTDPLVAAPSFNDESADAAAPAASNIEGEVCVLPDNVRAQIIARAQAHYEQGRRLGSSRKCD